MKKGLTEIVILVDASGSMSSVQKDTIGGINTFIQKQKEIPGSANFTLVFFNTEMETKHYRVDLQSVNSLSDRDYVPAGFTALIDSSCRIIDRVGKELAYLSESERPEKVIVAILTDGQENASREFSISDLSQKIKTQTDTYKWEFLFLGANIDAFATGSSYSVKAANTKSYNSSAEIATRGFMDLNASYTAMRTEK